MTIHPPTNTTNQHRVTNSGRFIALALIFAVLLPWIGSQVQAQDGIWNKADRAYRTGSYMDAVLLYESALKQRKDAVAMRRLGECHEYLGNTQDAAVWYGQLAREDFAKAEDKKKYADLLKMLGQYDDARKWYETWGETGGDPEMAARQAASCAWAKEQIKESKAYKVKPAPFNSAWSEIAPVYYDNGLVFASNRERGFGARVESVIDGSLFYDLYYVDITNPFDDEPDTDQLRGKVNTKLHDGPATFEKGGEVMYFTKSHSKLLGKSEDSFNKLCVVQATTKNGRRWRKLDPLPFNETEFSCGHPSLSPDGRRLYFASDAPGGYGGADLYVSYKIGSSWGTPENLGPDINTPGDEMFPYAHSDEVLMFASDGHIGFGGLDIFHARINGKDHSNVQNAGYPLNSSSDDFGVAMRRRGGKGYFCSDRKGGKGSDDIYTFERQLAIKGKVVDSRTGKPVPGVKVKLMNANGAETTQNTGEEGTFSDYTKPGVDLYLVFTKEGYKQNDRRVSVQELGPMEDVELTIQLEREAIWSMVGRIVDGATGNPVEGALISYQGDGPEKILKSDSEGAFVDKLNFDETVYNVVIMKDGFVPVVRQFSTEGKKEPQDFRLDVAMKPGYGAVIIGSMLNKDNGRPVNDGEVQSISMEKFEQVNAVKAASNGTFRMVLEPGEPQYLLGSNGKGFFSSRIEMPFMETLKQDTMVYVRMELVPQMVGATAKIIYFGYNKSDLRKEAKQELMDIVWFLKDNPKAKVELSSHTDSRGGDRFNEKLSQRRADSAVRFIVKKGVDKDRITAKGYGRSKPVNRCKAGVKCPEEAHAENRRCELTITGIDK